MLKTSANISMEHPDLDKTFDVIIVGAGPAGCVLASRLSEVVERQVLLIEAGGDIAAPGEEHPDVLDPFCLMASNNASFHWPNLNAQTGADLGHGSPRATTPYVQGCGVGGASNINGMGADRGQPGDYEAWRDLGAEGWGWDEVLPYFKKLEHDVDYQADSGAGTAGEAAASLHGHDGPMPVRRLPRARWAPFAAAMGDALERRGFAFLDDYMTDFREGFGAAPTNGLPERRVSASMAYLTREVRRRTNLTLISNARADRVSFEGTRANGIFVRIAGVERRLSGREVVLTCGAIQTPAVLMRSGIGPREQLANLGVPMVRDMRGVGANLLNHPCVSLAMFLPRSAAQPKDNPAFLQNWARYSSKHPGCAPNDMHVMMFNKCSWHTLGRQVGMVATTVLQAFSQGRVELTSRDPDSAPKISFNLMADPRDEKRLIEGVRSTLKLLLDPLVMKTRHDIILPKNKLVASLNSRTAWNRFRAWVITFVLGFAPLRRWLLADSRVDARALLNDERALRDFVRRRASVQFHVSGTCRMGRADDPDPDAVVDGAGRVHGIQGLRVSDASIFPTMTRGYTHFIVIMAAEKLADDIKAGWDRMPAQQ